MQCRLKLATIMIVTWQPMVCLWLLLFLFNVVIVQTQNGYVRLTCVVSTRLNARTSCMYKENAQLQ